jgi:hypothetical protein
MNLSPRAILSSTAVLLCLSAGALAAPSETPGPRGLFQAAEIDSGLAPVDKALPGRTRVVRVNRGQLRSGRLYLNLGLAPGLSARLDRRVEGADGRITWLGSIAGDPGSSVALSAGSDAVAGTIRSNGRMWTLAPRGNGLHLLAEVPPGDPYPEMDPIPVADTGAAGSAGAVAPAADDGSTIDVLVVYTPASMSVYGAAGVESLINLAVAETNQAYLNSGVTTRLNLVGTALVDYTESGSMSTDLSRLTAKGDGYMDQVHALRDQLGADTVTLIEESPDYCGIAWLMSGLSAGFESYAFSVVYSACATGYYSFGHELGHNQGCAHDHDNATSGLFDYSFGWQEPNEAFRTIMAYNCTSGCSRVQHFSSPNVLYGSQPTGVADYADNARSIDEAAFTVANWRDSTPLLPPAAPDGLTAAAEGTDRIALAWTDAADNEAGFRLERAESGGGYAEIAVLPADTVAYSDTGLAADTTYSYRVYAFNSAGESAHSNSASATTEPPPAFVEYTAGSELPAAGSVAGSYQDTWTADGVSEVITERESGGKPSNRYAYLEHTWTIQVQPAASAVLQAIVTTDAAGGEAFVFAYSTDGVSYADAFTVTAASAGEQSFLLPPGIAGTLYVRVTDTERVSGLISSYSVAVDQLLVRAENGSGGEPPAAPSDLAAAAASSSAVDLSWSDNATDEYGYELERSGDGGVTWDLAASLPADSSGYTDTGLAADTTYAYRVLAFNAAGRSGYSAAASATTWPGAAISLGAAVEKVRGLSYVDLSWSGATAAVDILRDAAVIAAGEANDGTYRDELGKVRDSVTYQVCETGTSTCSEPVTVTP